MHKTNLDLKMYSLLAKNINVCLIELNTHAHTHIYVFTQRMERMPLFSDAISSRDTSQCLPLRSLRLLVRSRHRYGNKTCIQNRDALQTMLPKLTK